jgi:hypothetical protein
MLACSLTGVVRGGVQTVEEIESRRKNDILSTISYIEQDLQRALPRVVQVLRAALPDEQHTGALDQIHLDCLNGFQSTTKEWKLRPAKDFNNDIQYFQHMNAIFELTDFKFKSIIHLGQFVYKADVLNKYNFLHVATRNGNAELSKVLLSLGFQQPNVAGSDYKAIVQAVKVEAVKHNLEKAPQYARMGGSIKDLQSGKSSDAAFGLKKFLKVSDDWDSEEECKEDNLRGRYAG